MKNIVIIGENTDLLNKIEKSINLQLIEIKKHEFSNDNFIYEFDIDEISDNISIICDISNQLHKTICGLFFCLEYLKSNNRIIDKLIFPYFPYSRSHNTDKNLSPNLKTIISILNQYPICNLITFDAHFRYQEVGFKGEKTIIAQDEIFYSELFNSITEDTIIVGPDHGSKTRVDKISTIFGIKGFNLKKKRISHNEKVEYNFNNNFYHVMEIINSKRIIIVDDEICTGNTLKKLVNYILKINPKINIYIFITHSFIDKIPNFFFFDNIKKIFISNTIYTTINLKFEKIVLKDVTKMIIQLVEIL